MVVLCEIVLCGCAVRLRFCRVVVLCGIVWLGRAWSYCLVMLGGCSALWRVFTCCVRLWCEVVVVLCVGVGVDVVGHWYVVARC